LECVTLPTWANNGHMQMCTFQLREGGY
jgi:hypothetical protein